MVAWNSNEVKVNDTYTMAGKEYACVEALDGEPFVGGDTYPVATRYGVVPADEVKPSPHKFHITQKVIYNRQDHYTDFIGLSPTVEATIFAPRRGYWQQPMYEIKWGDKGWAIVEESKLSIAKG